MILQNKQYLNFQYMHLIFHIQDHMLSMDLKHYLKMKLQELRCKTHQQELLYHNTHHLLHIDLPLHQNHYIHRIHLQLSLIHI